MTAPICGLLFALGDAAAVPLAASFALWALHCSRIEEHDVASMISMLFCKTTPRRHLTHLALLEELAAEVNSHVRDLRYEKERGLEDFVI